MANVKRLLCRRFGGFSNFISYVMLITIVYLAIQYFLIDPANDNSILEKSNLEINRNKILDKQDAKNTVSDHIIKFELSNIKFCFAKICMY